jgi:hypothetical protein
MGTVAQPQAITHVAASRARRRWFLVAVAGYIGWNLVASIVGLIAKLPDLTTTHAHTDKISVGQVLVGSGTIMSPPLVAMVVVGLLAWTATTVSRAWLSRAATVLTTLIFAGTLVAESTGFGDKPALFSDGKWHLCIGLGIAFDLVALAAFVAGVLWMIAPRRSSG